MTPGELLGFRHLLDKQRAQPLTRLEEKTLNTLQLKAALRSARKESGLRILGSEFAAIPVSRATPPARLRP